MLIKKLFLAVFGNNWRIVLLSVAAATTFWFFNALNKNYSTRLNYPLEFIFQRDSVVVVKPLPDRVLIDVSGGGWNLMRKTFLLSAGAVVIELDNPTDIKFLTRASLMPMITEQLSGIRLDFVVTDTVLIDIETKISKKLAVAADSLSIPLRENFRLVSPITLTPDSILVEGPESMIDTLANTYLLTFPDRLIGGNFDDEFDVNFGNNLLRPMPDEIQVQFETAEFFRNIISVPIEVTNFPSDSSVYLKDSLIDVHYTVRSRDLNRIVRDDFNISADLTMLNKADSTIPPILIAFPAFVMEIELDPDTLKVDYGK